MARRSRTAQRPPGTQRYIEAFPPLQEAKADPIKEELKLPAKTSYNGVAVFAFPFDKKVFDGRKGLTLRVQMYDNPTLVAVEAAPKQ